MGNGVRRKSSSAYTKSSNESTLEQIMGFIQENNPAGVVAFLLNGKQVGSEKYRFEKREWAGCKSMNKLLESMTGWI